MRILSSYHDYYDGVMAHGQTGGPVFVRETQELEDPERRRRAYPEPPGEELATNFVLKRHWVYGKAFWLAVAGRVYRGYRLKTVPRSSVGRGTEHYLYSTGALSSCATDLGMADFQAGPAIQGGKKRRRWVEQQRERERRSRAEWLARQGTEELRDVLVAAGVTISGAFYGYATVPFGTPPRRAPLLLNPRLADFQFQKVLDAFTVFQEISMWLGGVLPQRDAMRDRVSDRDRFVEHGFDLKTSFRGSLR